MYTYSTVKRNLASLLVGKEFKEACEEKEKILNTLRQRRLCVLKKASLLKRRYISDDGVLRIDVEQFDQLIYGAQTGDSWLMLYHSINELYGGALDRLQKQLPQLSDAEFRVCCLIYAQLNSADASIVLNVSSKTVLNLRSIIRKKLAKQCDADVYEYLKCLSRNTI